ncbi:hypothetical protein QUF72_10620 [Desulfobacterales bacterium HSG2]|nr:hypothetical protein [Desulfobacterales bacterium HSG2]
MHRNPVNPRTVRPRSDNIEADEEDLSVPCEQVPGEGKESDADPAVPRIFDQPVTLMPEHAVRQRHIRHPEHPLIILNGDVNALDLGSPVQDYGDIFM